MLRELEEQHIVDRSDGYALMEEEVAAELVHLGNMREKVMQEMRSLEAVYRTPLPPTPPPPHRTTLTLAVCPPNVYSHRRVATDQTLTVPSLEEDANRGAVALLQSKIVKQSLR